MLTGINALKRMIFKVCIQMLHKLKILIAIILASTINLVLIVKVTSKGPHEPVHRLNLMRTFIASFFYKVRELMKATTKYCTKRATT